MPRKKRVIIVGDSRKGNVGSAIRRFSGLMRERFHIVRWDLNCKADLARTRADIVIVFGGDGSLISTCRRMGANQMPVLGVNLGKLGFMADVVLGDFEEAIGRVLAGDYAVTPRMMLRCRMRPQKGRRREFTALNDVVVARHALSRITGFNVAVDGKRVTTYLADGLIISSPTGSTAHSLAAGGPILAPDLEAILLTPICPHTLGNRPLVLGAGAEIEIRVDSGAKTALVVDGQEYLSVKPEDRILVSKLDRKFGLLETARRSYYEILRSKLGWGEYALARPAREMAIALEALDMTAKTARFVVKIDREVCKGCGFCVEFCARGSLVMDTGLNLSGAHPAMCKSGAECSGCANCALICPDCAIEIIVVED